MAGEEIDGPLFLPSAGRSPRNSGDENRSNDASLPPGTSCGTQEFILTAAANLASQPVVLSDPDVWGVLTAISIKARKRCQGRHMLLKSDEHFIGRLVEDAEFQILSPAVSSRHCRIYQMASKDAQHPSDNCFSVFLKDMSTNGTYLNWEKLSKSSSEAKVCHGDIISIAFPPQHDLAYAFVFREVKTSSTILKPTLLTPCRILKRKPDGSETESKRLKGIGIGSSEGPVSLDDFRSLQRSNMELRKLLEDKDATIVALHNENRLSNELHGTEIWDLRASAATPYVEKIYELGQSLEALDKELAELNRVSTEQKHEIDNLNRRLHASEQSSFEATEIINSQRTSISELKALLDEERDQRREERDKSFADMKIALQKVQAEAVEEMKRMSDSSLKREKELQDVINKLQERSSRAETLQSKLEDTQQKLADSNEKVRQLECRLSQEREAAALNRKKVKVLELAKGKLKDELENAMQFTRVEAQRRISAVELRINATMSELDYERQRLKASKERIMLRETQLRAFYSTTEEMQQLFAKQQEQLNAMRRTLEDDGGDFTPTDVDGIAATPAFGDNADSQGVGTTVWIAETDRFSETETRGAVGIDVGIAGNSAGESCDDRDIATADVLPSEVVGGTTVAERSSDEKDTTSGLVLYGSGKRVDDDDDDDYDDDDYVENGDDDYDD